jgi:hypothetical protein
MFVQHKQLKVLNVPATKVARLKTSTSTVQLAFTGYPPQIAEAYLVALSGGNKVLILVGFYLTESKISIFFVPQQGEAPVEEIEPVFEEGFVFAESMGFTLSETDYHLLSSADQQKLWQSLPICRATGKATVAQTPAGTADATFAGDTLENYRQRSLESLGRFLSSM